MLVVAGIFVGGKGSRMGGIAKGHLLAAPDREETILDRSTRILHSAGVNACVLVGDPRAAESLPVLEDDPRATGPLAGVLALLEYAATMNADHVVSIACDMPFITERLLGRLLAAPPATVLAPRDSEGRWQPFFARWDRQRALPIAQAFAGEGGRKLQLLFDRAEATPFELDLEDENLIKDWDSPEDLPPNHPGGKTNASP